MNAENNGEEPTTWEDKKEKMDKEAAGANYGFGFFVVKK